MAKAKAPRTIKPKAEKKVLQMPENGSGNGSSTHVSPAELESQIRVRAYELYAGRGYTDGQAVSDWLAAEREILSRNAQKHTA